MLKNSFYNSCRSKEQGELVETNKVQLLQTKAVARQYAMLLGGGMPTVSMV